MKTIKETTTAEIIIKNSRFITTLIRINNEDDVLPIINRLKKEQPKATHYCYAYITENKKKSSDDKEPSGTAGLPMLNILEKENLINILAVTTRYFGGIKLGAGGLVRAYSKSVKTTLEKAKMVELERGYQISITTSYSNQKELDYLLKNYQITEKSYQEKITYIINIPKNDLNILSNYQYQIIKELYIEKVHI